MPPAPNTCPPGHAPRDITNTCTPGHAPGDITNTCPPGHPTTARRARLAALLAPLLACASGDAESIAATDPTTTTSATTTAEPTTAEPTTAPTTGAPELPACDPVPALALVPDATARVDTTITPGRSCALTLSLATPRIVEFTAPAAALAVDDRPEDEPGWQRPRELAVGEHTVLLTNPGDAPLALTLELRDLGEPPPPTKRERSLVWTQPQLVDPPNACGLACLLAAVADDHHGGRLLQQWFVRFATTPHSERLGPQQLLAEFAATQPGPPETWDLAGLPFIVTAVHSRLDLATPERCGELRVSLASTHPIYRPFHLIFLFAQPPVPGDISPGGALHCTATALRLARLGQLADAEFFAAALALRDERVRPENFLAAESVEFTISPWEWRQWFLGASVDDPMLPRSFDDRPLFQTVDTPRLNQPGPDRDNFLAWVSANADAIDQRRILIPDTFRPLSARLNQGVAWVPLQLPPDLEQARPTLRKNLEIVGCPACHATDADFVQTLPNRSFSPFYDQELDARALHLDALARGAASPPPYGPLQPDPLLPP